MREEEVVVVIGVRGFGLACARRLAPGRRLLIGDADRDQLAETRAMLEAQGYRVASAWVDVSDPGSVAELAASAAALGGFKVLVHAAGLSPAMATWERIFAVNLLGTIHVLDAFREQATPGAVAIVMASNAAYYAPLTAELEAALAQAPVEQLRAAVESVQGHDTSLGAYWLAKRSNQLRVQAQAAAWGARGARVLSVSPGLIATPMIAFEREQGSPVDLTVASQPIARIGTPDDIAAAVAWLSGPEASYVSGTDLLIDGGMNAAMKWSSMTTDYLDEFKTSTG